MASGELALVMLGTGAEDEARPLREAIAAVGRKAIIRMPGYRQGKILRAAYAEATALVFPSLCESFGIPVVEAMAQGIPAALADSTALPEIGGAAGWYFNPREPGRHHRDDSRAARSSRGMRVAGSPWDEPSPIVIAGRPPTIGWSRPSRKPRRRLKDSAVLLSAQTRQPRLASCSGPRRYATMIPSSIASSIEFSCYVIAAVKTFRPGLVHCNHVHAQPSIRTDPCDAASLIDPAWLVVWAVLVGEMFVCAPQVRPRSGKDANRAVVGRRASRDQPRERHRGDQSPHRQRPRLDQGLDSPVREVPAGEFTLDPGDAEWTLSINDSAEIDDLPPRGPGRQGHEPLLGPREPTGRSRTCRSRRGTRD